MAPAAATTSIPSRVIATEEPGQGGEVTVRSWASYRPVAAFNAANLQGEALAGPVEARKAAEGVEPKPEQRLEAAEAVLGAYRWRSASGGSRLQSPRDRSDPAAGSRQLPLPCGVLRPWAHEQIHSTGYESSLKRDLGGAFGKQRYAREELVAELGAMLLVDQLDIGSEIESHAADLGHWIEMLKESPKVLFQVLSEARQAADLICPEGAQPEVKSLGLPA